MIADGNTSDEEDDHEPHEDHRHFQQPASGSTAAVLRTEASDEDASGWDRQLHQNGRSATPGGEVAVDEDSLRNIARDWTGFGQGRADGWRLEDLDLHRASAADQERLPGVQARTLLGSTLNWCCERADPAPVAPSLANCVEYSIPWRVPASAMIASGVLTRWQITVSTEPEDPRGLCLVAHSRDDLRREHEACVEPAGLLDPGGHPAHAKRARRTHRRSASRTGRGACGRVWK